MAVSDKALPDCNCPTIFRNCEKQTLQPVIGTVRGSIPSWLKGELTQTGPGIQKVGNDQYSHVFDGLAILHRFQISDGKAYYQNRALHSDTYSKNMEANRIVVSEYGTRAYPDPCQSLFGRLKADFHSLTKAIVKIKNSETLVELSDNCSINVGYYGDQLYAMTESNCLRRVDPFSLKVLGEKTKIDDYVPLLQATAHPHILADGTALNVGHSVRTSEIGGRTPYYSFIKIPPSFNSDETSFANAKVIAQIQSRWKLNPGYFHSFGVTNTGKVIFLEQPYCINLLKLGFGNLLNRPFYECQKWHPTEKTRFYVVSMESGEIHPVFYETDRLFVFHHINAYEDDGQIIVDVAGYNDAEWVGEMIAEDRKKPPKHCDTASPRRYILPLNIEGAKPGENLAKSDTLATAMVREEKKNIVDVTPHHFIHELFETPRINYKYNGRKYRYMYGVGYLKLEQSYVLYSNTLTKIDTKTGEKFVWYADEKSNISEPVFVPDSTKSHPKEDDGILLAAMLHENCPTEVSLLVIDAKDMSEIARVNFVGAGTVTCTYHGQWAQSGERVHIY